MPILIPIISNIIAVVVFYLLEKKTSFVKIKNIYRQLLIGLVFGGVAIIASEFGLEVADAKMNVRDSAPLSAGLIFGWQAGILSGLIGGGYRALSVLWGGGTYTALACSISAAMAGVVAALLRKFMFDDKKPNWAYAFGIAIVMEVFHMLMIFITNMDDANSAFAFVRQCTILMSTLNALTVGGSVLIVTLLSKERVRREKGKEQIAQTFQRWLVCTILIVFIVTSFFTYSFQTGMRETQIEDTFKSTMTDVIKDIEEKSDSELLEIAKAVKAEYVKDSTRTANDLLNLEQFYGKITDVNLVTREGIVLDSTDEDNEKYDFYSGVQSQEFMTLAGKPEDTYYVQNFQKNGYGEMRKYAAIVLPSDERIPNEIRGGFIQISYNETQFRSTLDGYVIDFTRNRHVGTNGFVAVCDERLSLITMDEWNNLPVTEIGLQPPDEMIEKQSASQIYTTNIINEKTGYEEEHLYVFTFTEEYCIIVAMPESDAMLIRDASAYLSIFTEVVIFGVLFVLLYFLIKKLVIDNIHKINGTLSKISSGNLNETVDVREYVEFASLSDDINSTVDTLKRYIKEAAARIDKELEYAKQIQLSALPSRFPDEQAYEIRAQMIAAKEVGGDFYDFYKLSDNLVAFLVADVSGKGIPAAMFMMTAKTIIKDLAERGLSVNDIFTKANEKLCENNESGMFVTAWMGILNTQTGVLTYANAGHNPPLLYKDGEFGYLKSRAGFVLAGMEGVRYRINELQLHCGDRLFLYTDGVTEATDENTVLYGEDRLLAFMNENKTMSAVDMLPTLKENIDSFVGNAPQFDDITMLIFDYKQEKMQTIDKKFPAKIEALQDVLGFVEENLDRYGCSMKHSMAICVAIEEVFVNIAHYAYGDGEGEVGFSIGFNEETREVVFEMSDSGIPFNPLEKPDPDVTLSAEERDIGGLGILITKKTMDLVSYRYENGENILTMHKKI